MLERNHQSLKNSIKASLVELGEKYQSQWMQFLPWALLGRRTAFNEQLGTSSAEMTFGFHPQVPGTLLQDPEDLSPPSLEKLLAKLQVHNNRVAPPTSAKLPDKIINEPADTITHVYTRQHDTRGLQSHYRGPFKILSRPSRSTILIKVGTNRDGSERTELRNWQDVKSAYLREGTADAERPKRGRPSKTTTPTIQAESSLVPALQTNVSSIQDWAAQLDYSIPPPMAANSKFPSTAAEASACWSASSTELAVINASIASSPVRCEARG